MKKKHIAQSAFSQKRVAIALLLCAACWIVAGTVLAFFHAEAPTKAFYRAAGGLTLADRVAAQRAIEEVYWRHRIWPTENSKPKPSLDEVMSTQQIEKKVEDYVRDSRALEDCWQRPITPQQLQAEMERMARNTKQPEVLRELFEALGNDPFVIAECLARPVLTKRLAADPTVVAGVSPARKSLFAADAVASTENRINTTNLNKATYTLPEIDPCTDDTWTPTSGTDAPDARSYHTAVWTGSEMIVWGGTGSGGNLNTGGRYNPSTDSWAATSTTNAPFGAAAPAVWTGSEMIVWGGDRGSGFSDTGTRNNRQFVPSTPTGSPTPGPGTGGRYDPANDTWTATSTTNAPNTRGSATAVWTGSEMIVWGGEGGGGKPPTRFDTGGRYDPSTDSWTATNTTGAPAARASHSAVWTGSQMIVWGGVGVVNQVLNTGGRYNPSTNSWTATNTTGAPAARASHSAVWTGSQMIVWGGPGNSNTGGRYEPSIDSWTATSTIGAPVGRIEHTAIWTGSEMIVWGGFNTTDFCVNTGGRYDPSSDSWTVTSTNNVPATRDSHTAIWTGSEMIVWGGFDCFGFVNTGGRYCAQSGAPSPTATPGFTPTPTATATTTATATPNSTPRPPPTPRPHFTPAPRP
jgi:N-acetylneuraminic acid mutarotase